jgi:hypothetical protein
MSGPSPTLKMETVLSSVISVNFYWTTWHHIPEDITLNNATGSLGTVISSKPEPLHATCFLLVRGLAYSSALKMEAACSSDISGLSTDYRALYPRSKNSSQKGSDVETELGIIRFSR